MAVKEVKPPRKVALMAKEDRQRGHGSLPSLHTLTVRVLELGRLGSVRGLLAQGKVMLRNVTAAGDGLTQSQTMGTAAATAAAAMT